MRSTRRSRPAGYVGQLFMMPLPLALLVWAWNPRWWAVVPLTFLLRSVAAYVMSARVLKVGINWLLLPVEDVTGCFFWLAGFFGNTVTWRGRRYHLRADGRFELLTLEYERPHSVRRRELKRDSHQLAVSQMEMLAAPNDIASRQPADPDWNRKEVARRKQPEPAPEMVIAQHMPCRDHGHRQARDHRQAQQSPSPMSAARQGQYDNRPRQGEGEKQSRISERP